MVSSFSNIDHFGIFINIQTISLSYSGWNKHVQLILIHVPSRLILKLILLNCNRVIFIMQSVQMMQYFLFKRDAEAFKLRVSSFLLTWSVCYPPPSFSHCGAIRWTLCFIALCFRVDQFDCLFHNNDKNDNNNKMFICSQ